LCEEEEDNSITVKRLRRWKQPIVATTGKANVFLINGTLPFAKSSRKERYLAIHKVFECPCAKTPIFGMSWHQGIRILDESPSTST